MKKNGKMPGGAQLKGDFNGQYYQTYANYFVRFFEEYWKRGIQFWALTIQNEPSEGLIPDFRYQSTNWSSEMERSFAKDLLQPTMRQSTPSRDVKIMALDDNRNFVLQWAKDIYRDANSDAIDGLAIHWYHSGQYEDLSKAHDVAPDKFILATEACTGWLESQLRPLLGDWSRGEQYGHDILNDLKNWVVGWTDWNLALDLQGGPNWIKNFVDAVLIVDRNVNEFYKQPMYYFIGHFSKFITRGSVRISSKASGASFDPNLTEHIAFETPEGNRVLVVMNRDTKNTFRVSIADSELHHKVGQYVLLPSSIITAIWKK